MSKSESKAENHETLAGQLRAMIRDSGLSVNAVAIGAGVPQPMVQQFVSGTRPNITIETAGKLCAFFGVRLTKPTRKPAAK